MELANILLDLGGDRGNQVPKKVTPGEILLLQAIHGDGSVHDIEPLPEVSDITNRSERERLIFEYARAMDGEGRQIARELFPGAAARVPETIAELGLPAEMFKPTGRVEAKPPAPKAASKPDTGLADKTVKELRALAEERGVDLGEAKKRDDILAVLAETDDGEGGADGAGDDGIGSMQDNNLFG